MKHSGVPTEAVSIYNHALSLSTSGEYNTALNEYMKAIEIHPTFIEAYNNMGEIYSRIGQRDLAIRNYQKALKIERNHRVLLNIGVEYYNTGDNQKALKFFTESIELKKNFLEGNFYTGMAWFNLKDYKKAEKYFNVVTGYEKKHLKANYLLAYIYYEWKKYAKTIECLDRIRDIADDTVFLNRYYGFCYYHLGDFDKAVSYLTVALESSPRYSKFKNYLKSLTYENKLKEIGDVEGKIQEMEEKIMDSKPSLREYTHLSMLYIFKGEYQKAESLLQGVAV